MAETCMYCQEWREDCAALIAENSVLKDKLAQQDEAFTSLNEFHHNGTAELQAENAALKEQVAQLELIAEQRAMQIEDQQETIAQQAEALRVKDVILEQLACLGNGDRHGNSNGNILAIAALALQPNPDILRERDLKTNLKLEREYNERHSGQAPDDISL